LAAALTAAASGLLAAVGRSRRELIVLTAWLVLFVAVVGYHSWLID